MHSLFELSDKVLGCWCVEKPIDYVRRDKVCHGEVLLMFVEMLKRERKLLDKRERVKLI